MMNKLVVNMECKGQCNELYMALSELYDVQNGPPLIQESLEYEKAMVNARKLLEDLRGQLGK